MLALTPDEKFLIALHNYIREELDPEEPVDCYLVGKTIGMKERQVDAICTLLMRANFIKRRTKQFIFLTENGSKLVESLISK